MSDTVVSSSPAGFAALGLSPAVLEALERKGFEEPTPIQAEVIPLLLGGNTDIIAQSHTGTGKTAAFGLPLMELIESGQGHVQALVLVPTRELALQVSEELNSLRPKGKKAGSELHIVPVYGGQSYELQFRHFRQGVDILVATPGRLIDHLQRGSLDLSTVKFVVLDEADEMLDMGFVDDIEAILGTCTGRSHMLLFSATMPPRIRDVANTWMKNPKMVTVQSSALENTLTEQLYFEVLERDKFEALGRIVDIEPDFYGLVFCRTKVESDNVCTRLLERGYDVEVLHGDVSQAMREKVLDKFRRKLINILVATDVAARGIDVENLTHVINYSLPTDPESYVHRIGRTGRAGKEGTAITFVSPDEFRKLRYIKAASKSDIRREKVPSVEEVLAAKRERIFDQLAALTGQPLSKGSVQTEPEALPQAFHDLANELFERASANGTEPKSLLAALLHYTLRDELDAGRYTKITEIEEGGGRRNMNYRDDDNRGNRVFDGPPRGPRSIPADAVRLYVARGKADGFTKPRVVEFLKRIARIGDHEIDGVEVYEFYSFVSVPASEAERILSAAKSGQGERSRDGKPVIRRADPDGAGRGARASRPHYAGQGHGAHGGGGHGARGAHRRG